MHDAVMPIYNHTGLVVLDLERSKRFYEEVLGFTFWYEITPPDEVSAKLNCLSPPLGMTASYLVLDGFVLELLHYAAPGGTAPYRARTFHCFSALDACCGGDYRTPRCALYRGAIHR